MALNTIHAIDYQNCIIEDLKSPLHLRSEIHMSWSVKQCYVHITKVKLRLLGKYRDSPVLFLTVRVKICILMIHTSKLSYPSSLVEHRLGERGLA